MRAWNIVVLCGVAAGLAAGCNVDPDIPPTVMITEDGCVTGGITTEDFILTDLDPSEPNAELRHEPQGPAGPTTEAYRLIGNTEELQAMVGRRVRVSGSAEREGEVEIRELSRPEPAAGTLADANGDVPTVDTVEQIRLEIHDLDVMTIAATGTSCEQISID